MGRDCRIVARALPVPVVYGSTGGGEVCRCVVVVMFFCFFFRLFFNLLSLFITIKIKLFTATNGAAPGPGLSHLTIHPCDFPPSLQYSTPAPTSPFLSSLHLQPHRLSIIFFFSRLA
jgi:hypothetical protein